MSISRSAGTVPPLVDSRPTEAHPKLRKYGFALLTILGSAGVAVGIGTCSQPRALTAKSIAMMAAGGACRA